MKTVYTELASWCSFAQFIKIGKRCFGNELKGKRWVCVECTSWEDLHSYVGACISISPAWERGEFQVHCTERKHSRLGLVAVERRFRSIDFKGQMILLGTGTSVGVPAIGCDCAVCTSSNPRNNRTRSGAILGLQAGNLLFDTSPDLRHQLLREGIGMVHSVVFTHEHADHLHGLDDLRLFPFVLGHPVPLYCAELVETRIRSVFDYAFDRREPTHAAAAPQLQIHRITAEPFKVLNTVLQPIPLVHGPNCSVLGFRIGNVAYCTDTNFISESSLELMHGLDCLVLDALRYTPHPTHFCVEEALEVVTRIKPKLTYLTHLSHDLDYDSANARLPENVRLAYDGQRIPLT